MQKTAGPGMGPAVKVSSVYGASRLLEVALQQAFQTAAVTGLIMEHIKKY